MIGYVCLHGPYDQPVLHTLTTKTCVPSEPLSNLLLSRISNTPQNGGPKTGLEALF